jgi:hypothetical protein
MNNSTLILIGVIFLSVGIYDLFVYRKMPPSSDESIREYKNLPFLEKFNRKYPPAIMKSHRLMGAISEITAGIIFISVGVFRNE